MVSTLIARRAPPRCARILPVLLAALEPGLRAQVTISEIHAAPNERALRVDADGQPRLGTGPAWFDPGFDDSAWPSGPAPLGFNVTGLGTSLLTAMHGWTSSLYARRSFPVSTNLAASTQNLRLKVDYNDGFIAFLNGREVARARLGPPRMFVYADQPAFSERPASPAGAQVFDLGPAHRFLQAGENLLAIQVANAAIDGKGDLKLDAGIELNDGVTTTTLILAEEFTNANGAARAHQNMAGSVTNTVSGALPPGSWLERAEPPVSDPAWTNLSIAQTLAPTGGEGNSGCLLLALAGDGPFQPARVPGPWLDMGAVWPTGAVQQVHLEETSFALKFKCPDGFRARLRLEPEGGAPADALDLGTLPPEPAPPAPEVAGWWRFEEHILSGAPVPGTAGAVIPNAPTLVNNDVLLAPSVTANAAKYSADLPGAKILDPLTGAIFENRFSFDATAPLARFAAPNHALLNSTSFTVEFFIKLTGEPTAYDSFCRRYETGPLPDGPSSNDNRFWQVDLSAGNAANSWAFVRSRWDTTGVPPLDYNRVVTGNRLLVDTATGSGNPADYPASGAVIALGDGRNDPSSDIWHHVALTYDGGSKRITIFTDYTAGGSQNLAGTFIHPNAPLEFGKFTTANGTNGQPWEYKLDEVRYTARVLLPSEMLRVATPDASGYYAVNTHLGAASAVSRGQFLSAVNASGHTGFRPVVELMPESLAPAPGKELRLDDVRVEYHYHSPVTPFVGLGSSLRHFVGAGEPSNGVWEPNLPKVPNNPAEAGKPAAFPDLPPFSDWVELRNGGSNTVDLAGWTLSDDPGQPAKWAFPAGSVIPAGGHLLVLCDDNAALTNAVRLHTNFKLSEGGETLVLHEGTTLRDEVDFPRQDAFHSFGRAAGDGPLGYFDLATPGAPNPGINVAERCKTPDFFAADGVTPLVGGFFSGAQTVVITTATPGAEIRYTTDGSEPTPASAAYGAGPLAVAPGANDKTGRVIRARAFRAGAVPSGTRTLTLLINQHTALKGVPALCFTGDAGRNFYKGEGVMAIQGGTYDANGVWTLPTATNDYHMGLMHGRAFERPVHLEWLRNDGEPGFAEEAGLRLASSPYSRPRLRLTQTAASPWPANSAEKPSFNLFFREDYGNSTLDYPFLGRDYPVKSFDELRPRAGKNDMTNPFIRDELVRRTFIEMGHKSVKGLINTLYVNGSYKGYFNTVERYREGYFQSHFNSTQPWDIRIIDTVEVGDSAEWNDLMAAAALDHSVRANYESTLSQIEVDEMIDYWLLNIYHAMWDWPQNNWVAARERSPDGRWRLHVWDAEGGFGSGKAPNYDTIGLELRATNQTAGQCRLFRGLYGSPEFRLRVADRVNKWFFNGAALDDRAPATCVIARLKSALTATFAPLLQYTHGQTYSDAFWNTWSAAANGRRAYLFNTDGDAGVDISFRSHGLWPQTEPPVFAQHGGVVPPGYVLAIATNGTAGVGGQVFFSTDGSDPRAFGGAVAAGAQSYTGPFALPGAVFTTVKARVRNGGNGEWSPLTEATFQLGVVPASATNLVVRQILYNPPAPSAAESTAGFADKEDFEFLELRAIGPSPVSLDRVAFAGGVAFDFGADVAASPVRALPAGGSALVVHNLQAFRARYGTGLDGLLAGEFLGSLANGGESVLLTGPDGPDPDTLPDVIRSFAYDDDLPWPVEADGAGASLLLRDPESNPDHALAANWVASAHPGGLPGRVGSVLGYEGWRDLLWNPAQASEPAVSGPLADPDGDGWVNLVEYALGGHPGLAEAPARQTVAQLAGDGGEEYLTIQYTCLDGLPGAGVSPVAASVLGQWQDGLHWLSSTPNPDGTTTHRYRDTVPRSASERRYITLRVTTP